VSAESVLSKAQEDRLQAAADAVEVISAESLLSRDFPPLRFIVPGIIPEGSTLIAAKPKMGKTWIGLGLGTAVSCAGSALINEPLDQGRVLYLALEDGERGIRDRLRHLLHGAPPPEKLDFLFECPRMDDGGLQVLETWEQQHPDRRLIIVDTLKRVRPLPKKGQNAYDVDYAALQDLTDFAHKHSIAVVVFHHLRKLPSLDDPFDEINGTMALTAVPDTNIVLRRTRGKAEAELHISGRLTREQDPYGMRFDNTTCLWTVTGSLEEQQKSTARRDLIQAVADNPGLKPKELGAIVGKGYEPTRQLLFKLRRDGDVSSDADGRYYAGTIAEPDGGNGHSQLFIVPPASPELVWEPV
jgi:AAA domain